MLEWPSKFVSTHSPVRVWCFLPPKNLSRPTKERRRQFKQRWSRVLFWFYFLFDRVLGTLWLKGDYFEAMTSALFSKSSSLPSGMLVKVPLFESRLQTVVLFDLALEVAAFRSRALQEDFWTSSSFISTQPETKWMQTKWTIFFLTALFTSCFCRKITFGKTTARINIALHLQKEK